METLTREEMIEAIKKDAITAIDEEIDNLIKIFKGGKKWATKEIINLSFLITRRVSHKNILSIFDFNQKDRGGYILGDDEIKLLYKGRKSYATWEEKMPLFFQVDCGSIRSNFNIYEYIYDLDDENEGKGDKK